jgi:hypothetical protein
VEQRKKAEPVKEDDEYGGVVIIMGNHNIFVFCLIQRKNNLHSYSHNGIDRRTLEINV